MALVHNLCRFCSDHKIVTEKIFTKFYTNFVVLSENFRKFNDIGEILGKILLNKKVRNDFGKTSKISKKFWKI